MLVRVGVSDRVDWVFVRDLVVDVVVVLALLLDWLIHFCVWVVRELRSLTLEGSRWIFSVDFVFFGDDDGLAERVLCLSFSLKPPSSLLSHFN